jgi:hypothetical protein
MEVTTPTQEEVTAALVRIVQVVQRIAADFVEEGPGEGPGEG